MVQSPQEEHPFDPLHLHWYLGLVFAGLLIALFTSDKGRRGFILAVRSLWLHKLRAVLSVLGIIIGTSAVITLMAFGEGSMKDALDDIARQGATNVIIRSVKPADTSSQRRTRVAIFGLTYADYERFKTIPTITQKVPMRIIFPQEIRYKERKVTGRVVATTPDYIEVNPEVKLTAGRFLNAEDDEKLTKRGRDRLGCGRGTFPIWRSPQGNRSTG